MNSTDITPVVLTFNEQDNIARCLASLHWAERVVVLDSGSTDETEWICRSNPRVEWHTRPFDSFAGQWNHARTLVNTPWMMAMDADYILPDHFTEKLSLLDDDDIVAWSVPFIYCINGQPLRASILPPRLTLFRPQSVHVLEDGQTQTFVPQGGTGVVSCPIRHDDRKPFARWWLNQKRYARQEAEKLNRLPWALLSPQDRLRWSTPFAPMAVAFYCLFVKGLGLDVPHGWIYTSQRVLAEVLLVRERIRTILF